MGQPLGSHAFAVQFLQAAPLLDRLWIFSTRWQPAASPPKEILPFTSCAQPRLPHLLQSDFHCNASMPRPQDMSLFHWSSLFTIGIKSANKQFLALLADTHPNCFSTATDFVTHLPASMGWLRPGPQRPPHHGPASDTCSPVCFMQHFSWEEGTCTNGWPTLGSL